MATFIVTYDLNKEPPTSSDRDNLLKAIKTFDWARLSESCYAISSTLTAAALFQKFGAFVDRDDSLFVMSVGADNSGAGPKVVTAQVDRFLAK